jgi:hypothetical protein
MTGRPRAQDVDRHVGARVRELRRSRYYWKANRTGELTL